MIHLIYGSKGSGKTKRIIDAANQCCASSKGDVVYITDNARSLDIDAKARFINIKDYGVSYECCLVAFVKGLVAANSDNQQIFIDGLMRFLEVPEGKMDRSLEYILTEFDAVSTNMNVDFTLTISMDALPKYMKKYV